MTTGSSAPAASPVVSAMSVDVEDYFQVSAFNRYIPSASWDDIPMRVERNVHRLLDLYAAAGVRATFFWLGWVAERLPGLVKVAASAGHEIASHGYRHVRAFEQDRAAFRADVQRTRALLQDLAGQPVSGYRAASFSIDHRNLWALEVLEEAGHAYSSSINPISHDHYGMRDAPRFSFRVGGGRIVEIPVTTVQFGNWRLPCGGGGYFRLLPYGLSRAAIRRVTATERRPAVFYFHPWEIDPDQPRVEGIDPVTRFRHYVNLGSFEDKLRRLSADFRWAPMAEVFAAQIDGRADCPRLDFAAVS